MTVYTPFAPAKKKQSPGFEGGSLAYAAGGGQPSAYDPWSLSGPQNEGAAPGSAAPISYGTPTPPQAHAVNTTPGGSGAAVAPNGQPIATQPTTPAAYDINTDPALQAVQSLLGMSDEQARASALKQKQDQLLAYGDENLARSLLGDDAFAKAAGKNPTSTLAQLGQQRGRNVHDLTEGLNKANLLYSGYRVNQEEQGAQDFQNALAQAAAGVNSSLGGIDSNLAGALGQNERERIAAMRDAYARHAQDPGAGDIVTAAAGGGGTDAAGGNVTLSTGSDGYVDPVTGQWVPYVRPGVGGHAGVVSNY